MSTLIYWFRHDLRLANNPALTLACLQAAQLGLRLLPVFCHAPQTTTRWGFARVGPHRQRYLRATLDDLAAALQARGSHLLELFGAPATTLPALCHALGATHVVCEDIAAPEELAEVAALQTAGLTVDTVWQSSLLDPARLAGCVRQFSPAGGKGLGGPAQAVARAHNPASTARAQHTGLAAV